MRVIVFLFLFAVSVDAKGSKFRFDYWYSNKADGYLKLHEVPATFKEAFLRCNAEGTVLASPLNSQVLEAMREKLQDSSKSRPVFTGIHASIAKGAYSTIEGVPMERLPIEWAPDEPDNRGNSEDCIVMLTNGTFADVSCDAIYPYFCYKKKTSNPVINLCGTEDNEYKLDARTGHCYKFHNVGRSWKRAYMICLAEGGHLAIINSATELQLIKDLYSQQHPSTVHADLDTVAHIGFYDWKEYRSFYTVHGETLQAGGYSKSRNSDDGKNMDGDAICGAVDRSGELYDVWCKNDIAAFICEKAPDSLVGTDD